MNARKEARDRHNLSLIRGRQPARPAAFTAPALRITRHEPSPWPALLRATVVTLGAAYGLVSAVLLTAGYIVYLSGHLAVVIKP